MPFASPLKECNNNKDFFKLGNLTKSFIKFIQKLIVDLLTTNFFTISKKLLQSINFLNTYPNLYARQYVLFLSLYDCFVLLYDRYSVLITSFRFWVGCLIRCFHYFPFNNELINSS